MLIRNFLFHRVSEEQDAMWSPMRPTLFTEVIGYLVQHFTIVPLEHYLQDPAAFPSDKKIATVQFDDGYKDNIEHAAPILKQFNCPASFYVVTDCIDKNLPTWTYIVDNVFQKTKKRRVELPFDFTPAGFKSFELKTGNVPNPLLREFKPWLKKLPNAQRLLVVQSLLDQCNDVALPLGKMMSWNDTRQLVAGGFIVGSHSQTHPLLASLKDESEISGELHNSGKRLQEELGKFPLSISYPNGSFDERVIRVAAKEGYSYGLAVEQRFFNTEKDKNFEIPRIELYQEPWWKMRMRISGMYGRIKKILT